VSKPVNVGILVFDEVEVLDFCGPFEVFATALIDGDGDRDERRLFNALIIAEGLETAEQLRVVREMGITAGQGYLLGKPLPGHDIPTVDVMGLMRGLRTMGGPIPSFVGHVAFVSFGDVVVVGSKATSSVTVDKGGGDEVGGEYVLKMGDSGATIISSNVRWAS